MFDLGKNIKELRKKAGLSQLELADKLGVSRSAVSSWEVNRNEPNIEDITKMASILDCPLYMLIDPDNMDTHFLLSDEDELVKGYRELTPDLKQHVRRLLAYFYMVSKLPKEDWEKYTDIKNLNGLYEKGNESTEDKSEWRHVDSFVVKTGKHTKTETKNDD